MKRVLFAIFALCVSLLAMATDYVLQEGNNVLKGFDSANCTFMAPRDCKVLVECQELFTVTYADVVYDYQYTAGSGLSYRYEVPDVKANTSISIKNDFIMNLQSVLRITLFSDGIAIPVEAVNFSPALNEQFSWTNTGHLSVNFNKAVEIDAIKFVANDYVSDVDDIHLGTSLSCNISNALNKALKDGVLKAGDKFAVKITGLRDAADVANLYGGNGELVLEYIAPPLQHNFVSATVAGHELSYKASNDYKFLSFYPLDGEDGLFVFEFDEKIGKVGNVVLTMGNLDLDAMGKYHRSSLDYSIQDNKLLVDARGTLRSLAVLFPAIVDDSGDGDGSQVAADFDVTHLTITLSNVEDINGNVFFCDNSGSVGTYSFVMQYAEIIDDIFIDGDNVTDGQTVSVGQEISLWLSSSTTRFTSLSVTYQARVVGDDGVESQESRVVTVTDFTVTPDPLQGVVISFVMPELPDVVGESTLRVSLDNVTSADGMPHSLYIEFVSEASTDGLNAVGLQPRTDRVFRLTGVEASQTVRGVVIKNGKKLVK